LPAIARPYEAERDFELFAGPPDAWIDAGPAAFTIFYPSDAHAPQTTAAMVLRDLVRQP
jgi:beta-galactosidase beta subunit